MLRKLRPRLTYANVVSTLCLFMLLGGTAWAVAANSVGTAQLKNDAVTTAKLANGAVTKPKLGAASVGTRKLADAAVTGAKLGNAAVTGANVADNSLTGADINSATLGTVPLANDANSLQGKTLGDWSFGPVVVNREGPLPIDQTSFATGRALLLVSGSGFRSATNAKHNGLIGLRFLIDDTQVGVSRVFTNELDSHKAFVTRYIDVALGNTPHSLKIEAQYDGACNTAFETTESVCTSTNGDDNFNVEMLRLPGP